MPGIAMKMRRLNETQSRICFRDNACMNKKEPNMFDSEKDIYINKENSRNKIENYFQEMEINSCYFVEKVFKFF